MARRDSGGRRSEPAALSMRAGDVVWIDFGIPVGSEPGYKRPAVVVSADLVLDQRPRTVHAVPLTTNVVRNMPTDVAVATVGLDRPSVAQTHLCAVVSVDRIDSEPVGNIGAAALAQVRSILADLLDL
jgi:mRNA interferase MazF